MMATDDHHLDHREAGVALVPSDSVSQLDFAGCRRSESDGGRARARPPYLLELD